MNQNKENNPTAIENRVYIKCGICGSTDISILEISLKQPLKEYDSIFDVKMKWSALCNNCNSQVIFTEQWISQENIFKCLSELGVDKQGSVLKGD